MEWRDALTLGERRTSGKAGRGAVRAADDSVPLFAFGRIEERKHAVDRLLEAVRFAVEVGAVFRPLDPLDVRAESAGVRHEVSEDEPKLRTALPGSQRKRPYGLPA